MIFDSSVIPENMRAQIDSAIKGLVQNGDLKCDRLRVCAIMQESNWLAMQLALIKWTDFRREVTGVDKVVTFGGWPDSELCGFANDGGIIVAANEPLLRALFGGPMVMAYGPKRSFEVQAVSAIAKMYELPNSSFLLNELRRVVGYHEVIVTGEEGHA